MSGKQQDPPVICAVSRAWTCKRCGAYVSVSAWRTMPRGAKPDSAGVLLCPLCGCVRKAVR